MSETAWPLSIETPAGRIEIYQPQPESLKGDMLDARAAVSMLAPGSKNRVFGAIWMSARISTDRDDRTVTIRESRLAGGKPSALIAGSVEASTSGRRTVTS
jgi:hypothetical protein